MNKLLKILLTILILFVMPVLVAYAVVKLFVTGKGTILAIVFLGLIALEVFIAIFRLVKYNKNKK